MKQSGWEILTYLVELVDVKGVGFGETLAHL